MITIEIRDEDFYGTISWDGRRYILSDPSNPMLRNLIDPEDPDIRIQDRMTGKWIGPENPPKYLTMLQQNSSPYCRISGPIYS